MMHDELLHQDINYAAMCFEQLRQRQSILPDTESFSPSLSACLDSIQLCAFDDIAMALKPSADNILFSAYAWGGLHIGLMVQIQSLLDIRAWFVKTILM